MNIPRGLIRQAAILAVSCVLFLLSAVPGHCQGGPTAPPPLPPDPFLDGYEFVNTNYLSDLGFRRWRCQTSSWFPCGTASE